MAKPPYQQIADEIRNRIATGDLGPGARVPSARQITARWGVAIATATKALAILQHEGLVKVVPGVGTVVGGVPPRPVPEPSGGGLSRELIVATAIGLADAEGMSSLSMRRIATELDVATMSLYRYIRSKDELILHMIDAAFGEHPLPVKPDGWRAQLETAARLMWALFRRHRWLAPVMSLTRPQISPNALAHTDWVLTSLDGLGLSLEEVVQTHVVLFSYVRGLATALETEAEAERDTGLTNDEWMQSQEATITAMARAVPHSSVLRLMMESELDMGLDSLLEFGLTRLLDGLAVLIAQRQAAARGRAPRRTGTAGRA
ncbi:AcrR family transcriptional regulator [Allocatelliglobosispora scoriae]|uniref:AcrR family transcriptional regulator n=1 Tax=Allocatelliglobosispora scoriae TaxID=643052 RepID=A0A841BWT7_9ACTN|nr:TetR/AcrR family transcriptional regulator C-terminal domain-containing protein [Allocatelliglobosispora scoriae]MBB5873587.1 AcrR family transcriptional regulator [Allocatelliglobosispora scoriae]